MCEGVVGGQSRAGDRVMMVSQPHTRARASPTRSCACLRQILSVTCEILCDLLPSPGVSLPNVNLSRP